MKSKKNYELLMRAKDRTKYSYPPRRKNDSEEVNNCCIKHREGGRDDLSSAAAVQTQHSLVQTKEVIKTPASNSPTVAKKVNQGVQTGCYSCVMHWHSLSTKIPLLAVTAL